MDIVKFTKDSPLQRIKAWYIDENSVELSDTDIEYKDRLFHIWSLRAKRDYSRQQAVDIIKREYNVSLSTAYRDYNSSQLIFGNIEATNAAAERAVYIERYERLYQLAVQQGNIALAKKINDSLVKMLPPAEDANKVDPKKLEASVFNVKPPRNLKKLMEQMASNGTLNFMGLGAEDADFMEVTEDEENVEEDE